MSLTVADATAFKATIAERLAGAVPADLATALADGVASGESEWRATPARIGETALNLRLGRYVIHDDDLPVIQTLGAVASAIVAGSATGGVALPALLPALTSLANLVWNLWRKGAVLNPGQLRVLGLLHAHAPCSTAALAPLAAASGTGAVPAETLEAVLRSLTEVEARDGSVIALAKSDAQGLWTARRV